MAGTYTGRTFGEFVTGELIGSGGVGEVYRAEQLALGREAVIKVLLRGGNPTSAERFLREAKLASRLDHPFAAHVYSFGHEPDGVLWIAMELVRGMPLDRLIKRQGPIALARFVPFFERLCEVLNAAHEQRIIHRDIKPANVMVIQRAGRLMPKLLDLGIARAQGPVDAAQPPKAGELRGGESLVLQDTLEAAGPSDTAALTQVGSVTGTPHYMAPEQWLDASSADARTDLYALGILAFQSLTGHVPFSRTPGSSCGSGLR